MAVDRIAYIKDKYSVLEYARDILGLPVRKSGDRTVSLAPNSHNPTALIVFDDSWHDFKLGIGGDVISLCAYARHNGDMGAAIRELAGDYGYNPVWKEKAQYRDKQVELWHSQLRDCDWRYLYRRGIKKETVDRLKIGYNEKEQRLIIPYWKNRHVIYWAGRDRSGDAKPDKYKKAYLDGYNENAAWGLWTFDDENREYVRKKIDTEPMSIDMTSMSKSGGSVSILESENLKKIRTPADRQKIINKYVIIAEGAFDALSFEQEGFRVLSPISGYFSKEAKKQVINLLKTVDCVFVCFDNDKAGSNFTVNFCKTLFKKRINFVCGVLPTGVKDISDYYAAGGNLFDLVEEAKSGIAMLAERITDKEEFKTFLYDVARFVDEPDIVELCENTKGFSQKWLATVLKKALKMPAENLIVKEITDKYILKYVEKLGFYEYCHGVWMSRSDNAIGNYLISSLGNWANGSKLNTILSYLKKETTTDEIFNRKPIFNFRNGVLELETGKFREHSEIDMSSIQVAYDYDEKAKCPKWEKFISEIMANRETSIKLLQEMTGYVLFNDCKLQKAFFLVGDGANGKSVFLNIIRTVFDEANVSSVEMSSLTEPFQRICLINSLVNISTETNSSVKGAESIFKQIVAGDPINGCYKNKDFIVFKPRCVMISACNEYIKSRDTTFGFLRRICFIDFPCKFEGDKADLTLEDKLKKELPGIFNWAYEGYKRLKKQNKLTETPEQEEIMGEFISLMNPVAAFIEECLSNENDVVEYSELYRRYVSWTKEAGHEAQSRTKFIQSFKKTIKQLMPHVQEGRTASFRFFNFKRELRPASDFVNNG